MLDSNEDLLKYVVRHGIIDLQDIQSKLEMEKNQSYLQQHPYEIWQGSNGKWYTYLIQDDKRKLIKRTSKKSIQQVIVDYYKTKQDQPVLQDIFIEWLNTKLKYQEISKQTYDRYYTDYERFIPEDLRATKIKNISEDFLEDFIKTTIVEQKLTAKAFAGLRTLLMGIFKLAYRKNYSDINIVTFFQMLDLSKKSFSRHHKIKEKEVFTESEMIQMADYIRQHPSIRNLGILLDMYTGLRAGELAGLKRSDINVSERHIHVQRTEIKYKNKNGKTMIEVRDYPKSEAGDRYLLLSDKALTIVRQIIQLNPFGIYLFEDDGRRISVNGFSHKIRRICEAINIPVRSMHKIRKTYGTTLLDAHADESFITEQMGHADIKTTRQFYYYSNKDKAERIQQLNKALYY